MASVPLFLTVQIKLGLSYPKVFLCFIKQMTCVSGKKNLKCFDIMNQIWTTCITYCLWKLDTVTIEYDKNNMITGHIFNHTITYLYLQEVPVYIWINSYYQIPTYSILYRMRYYVTYVRIHFQFWLHTFTTSNFIHLLSKYLKWCWSCLSYTCISVNKRLHKNTQYTRLMRQFKISINNQNISVELN